MGSKGIVASTAALAILLQQGIGDTIRVSLTPTSNEQRTNEVIRARQAIQVGALFSYSMFFDRFALKMQQGYYVVDAQRLNGSLYHRIGLRYALARNFYTQLTLKTHFAKADYGELGIGYTISR